MQDGPSDHGARAEAAGRPRRQRAVVERAPVVHRYREEIRGRRVQVWWDGDLRWFAGVVSASHTLTLSNP